MISPLDRCNALPEQRACIRVEYCMLTLREILPTAQYIEVRQIVHQWNVKGDAKLGRPKKSET